MGHGDPATTLQRNVRLMTVARAKAVAGLDEVTRTAIEAAQRDHAAPAPDSVVALAGRRHQTR